MSSTLSRPKAAAEPISARSIPPQPAPVGTADVGDDRESAGFVRAIALGVVVGVPVVGLLTAVIVKLAAPDMSIAGIVGVAVWVALWIGLFLGGTVTVGLWSARQHGDHAIGS